MRLFSSPTTASALLLWLLHAGTTVVVSGQNVSSNATDVPDTDIPVLDSAFNATGPMYNLCNVTDYYQSFLSKSQNPLEWSMQDLALHIEATHRNKALPNIADVQGDDDIYMALIDLDPGDVPNETVLLIYRNISYPAIPAGNPNTWKREDLWPIARGASRESVALTDPHFKAPADSTVLEKKDSLFFGACGTVETEAVCSRPATTETAPDTEQDDKVFLPPAHRRGDIARALFYGQLRYNRELGLQLADCPPFGDTQFGYLSQLLQWHVDDPVSPEEIKRNNRICNRWIGNRNPFIDYPELVEPYLGEPDTIIPGTTTYSKCTTPTLAPTATPNVCSNLKAGDIPVFLVNSDNPDQVVFFPLADISPAIGSLYVTDNAWTGTAFAETEGIMEFTIPDEGIKAGEAFGLGGESPYNENWVMLTEEGGGLFDLSVQGDQLFIYCLDADDLPNILWGFNYNGAWSEAGLEDYGNDKSALPTELENLGSNSLPHADNCVYRGELMGRKAELQVLFMDAANWECLDESRIEIDNKDGTETSGAATAVHTAAAVTTTTLLVVVGTLMAAAATATSGAVA